MFDSKQKTNQSGIALVLSVLILANLFIITIIVTDVILRIGRTSQKIGESEIAYFAAETAAEGAIYQIEANRTAALLGIPGDPTLGELEVTDGRSELHIEPVYTTPVTCVDVNQEINYHDVSTLAELITALDTERDNNSCLYSNNFNLNPLTVTNYLVALVRPGGSFEIDFDIAVPESIVNFYPGQFDIDWTEIPSPYGSGTNSPEGSVVILTETGQTVYDTSVTSGIKIPPTGNLDSAPSYRIRVINKSSNHVRYTFAPRDADNFPLGINITARGYYGDDKKERIVILERRNWQIY